MDTAAACPTDSRVFLAMKPFFVSDFGNPSSIHKEGERAKKALENFRHQAAEFIGALPDEIVFTSGGTESNNLALTAALNGGLLLSAIEHPSIMNLARKRQAQNLSTEIVSVSEEGFIDLEELIEKITSETKLVSVMFANNEIGSIQPIKEIAKIIRKKRQEFGGPFPYFHTDACQVGRFLPLVVNKLGVDLLTLNGAKIYGPKGSGLLYIRRGVPIVPLGRGGGQEAGRRPGTENLPAIAGLVTAMRLAKEQQETESSRLTEVRDYFWQETKSVFPKAALNGSLENRLPNNLNFSLLGFDAEQLVIELDARGIAVSTGSACSAKEADQSYVIMNISGDRDRANSALRFTLGRDATKKDAKKVVEALKNITNKLTSI